MKNADDVMCDLAVKVVSNLVDHVMAEIRAQFNQRFKEEGWT